MTEEVKKEVLSVEMQETGLNNEENLKQDSPQPTETTEPETGEPGANGDAAEPEAAVPMEVEGNPEKKTIDLTDEYAYTKGDRFTSENFKIEITNCPKAFRYGETFN